MTKILVLVLVAAIVGSGIYFFTASSEVIVPDRLSNIPEQAKWVGGTDGGNWYEVVDEISTNSFKIRIYNDHNGEILADTIFNVNADCTAQQQFNSETLMSAIMGYNGYDILLDVPKEGTKCYLPTKSEVPLVH